MLPAPPPPTPTHIPVASIVLIASPNASIFGLPLTAIIMSHTVVKASGVHFLCKHKCSFWFCRVGFLALVMSLSSPSSMTLLCRRSPTIASASTSLMNRSRNWSNTCSAALKGKTHGTPTSQHLIFTVGPPFTTDLVLNEWGFPL